MIYSFDKRKIKKKVFHSKDSSDFQLRAVEQYPYISERKLRCLKSFYVNFEKSIRKL